jgi:hypothetical protein
MKNIHQYSIGLAALLALLIIVFTSCRKEKQDKLIDRDANSLIEYAMTDNAFNDVAGISDEAYNGSLQTYRTESPQLGSTLSGCATISFDTTTNPKSYTVDFGTTDCLCGDGNYRRGKISVTWTGAYRDSGSSHAITFNNYFVNYNQLLGTKTVTNNGTNTQGQPVFTVTVNGSVIWDPQYFGGGGTSTMVSTRTRVWTAGYNTPFIWLDDIYQISGTASGVTRTGNPYSMNTASPLVKEIGFRHFTNAVLEFTPGNLPTRSIDYGYVNGQRDNLARVTVAGQSFIITLR